MDDTVLWFAIDNILCKLTWLSIFNCILYWYFIKHCTVKYPQHMNLINLSLCVAKILLLLFWEINLNFNWWGLKQNHELYMDFKNNITRALFKTLDKVERISLPDLCKLTLCMPSCRTKYSNFYGCNRKISFTVFCNLFICQRRKSNLLLHFNSSAQREAFFTLFPALSTVLSQICRP